MAVAVAALHLCLCCLLLTCFHAAIVLRCCCPCCCRVLQPLLDVLLFTHSLSKVMGYKGQLGLYAYYVFVAWLLRALAPPLASMTAQESALVGAFRCEARMWCCSAVAEERKQLQQQSGLRAGTFEHHFKHHAAACSCVLLAREAARLLVGCAV